MLSFDNRVFKEKVIEWPEALEWVDGVKTFVGNDFARTRGWNHLHWRWAQTNMVVPMFYLQNGEPTLSKDVMRLDRRMYWIDEFWKSWLGPVIWPRYCQPGAGYQDTNEKNTNPDVGPFKQQTIDDGCNLHRLVGNPFWTRLGQFQQIEAVDYFSHPDTSELNYRLTPHLVHKNTLASISEVEDVAYITHQKNGDEVWPNLFEHPLIHSTANLETFPKLPFHTRYLGESVDLTGFCFQASTVYGLFPDGWRVIEDVNISGIGSAYYDRNVMVSNWLATPPPTIKGWTLGRDERFDWQKS